MKELIDKLEERPSVSGHVSPNDAMDYTGLESYFHTGQSALEWIRLAMLAARKQEIDSILDFACGHGRVLRTLKGAFPDATLAACDIDEDAVDFCRENFDATPIIGRERPEEIEIGQDFDLIWCGSLFTHLSAPRWGGFLKLLESCLRPGGLLLFSTHGRIYADRLKAGHWKFLTDEQTEKILAGYDEGGFGYCDYVPDRKNPRLHDSLAVNWGMAVAAPSWVHGQLEQDVPELRLLLYMERAWPHNMPTAQDVLAMQKDSSRLHEESATRPGGTSAPARAS